MLRTETNNLDSLAFTCTFVMANLSVVGERYGLGILTLYGIGDGLTEAVGDGIVLFKVLGEESATGVVLAAF